MAKQKNDDAFDENGLLKDGQRSRVRMTMRDSRGVLGNVNRPGYRLPQINDRQPTRDAHAAYEQELRDAWKNPVRDDSGAGSDDFIGGQIGDTCTVRGGDFPDAFGNPGTLQLVNGQLTCVPNDYDPDDFSDSRRDSRRKPVHDDRARALAERDAELRDAWRSGK